MKNTPMEVKNNLQGNNNRVNKADNQISDLKHKQKKTVQKKKESKM